VGRSGRGWRRHLKDPSPSKQLLRAAAHPISLFLGSVIPRESRAARRQRSPGHLPARGARNAPGEESPAASDGQRAKEQTLQKRREKRSCRPALPPSPSPRPPGTATLRKSAREAAAAARFEAEPPPSDPPRRRPPVAFPNPRPDLAVTSVPLEGPDAPKAPATAQRSQPTGTERGFWRPP